MAPAFFHRKIAVFYYFHLEIELVHGLTLENLYGLGRFSLRMNLLSFKVNAEY